MLRVIAGLSAIWTNCAKRLIAWKPTKRSDPTASTGEPSTANYGHWPKIGRCGDDLQAPSGDPRRRRSRRNPRARLPGADRFKPETLGLTLAEGKIILKDLQAIVVEGQLSAHLPSQRPCPDCGGLRALKGYHDFTLKTVFGALTIKSPRLLHCTCRPHGTKTF